MPVSRKRKSRATQRNKPRSGNPMAHKNRPLVHGGKHPLDPDVAVFVPAPMVSKRRTPRGHLANLEARGKDIMFGLMAMEIIPKLSAECISLLTKASADHSPSQALAELMMNRVPAKMDLTIWLEEHYLGTWDEPYHAIEVIAGHKVFASLSKQQLETAYTRATQAFMIQEHYFEDGRVTVSFAKDPFPLGFFGVIDWVLEGRIPPIVPL